MVVDVSFTRSFFVLSYCLKASRIRKNLVNNGLFIRPISQLSAYRPKRIYTCKKEYDLRNIWWRFEWYNTNVKHYSNEVGDGATNVMNFYEFAEVKDKHKEVFHAMIGMYDQKFPNRKGVVDFIYAALKNMEDYGVHKDQETYKMLLNLFPKGKYLTTLKVVSELKYFPREQDCALHVLYAMEKNGVEPDVDFKDILEKTFGSYAVPTKKFYKMMYWIPKLKNLSPWPLPKLLPNDSFELAKLAIERITSVDLQTKISVFRTEEIHESLDKTWIISGQSPTQQKLIEKHDRSKPVIVEGGDHVWLREARVSYFVLKSEDVPYNDEPPPSIFDITNLESRFLNPNYVEEQEDYCVHKQEDGYIYAVCATGTSKKDSLLSWIRLLQKNGNPKLADLAVLFRFRKAIDLPVPVTHQ